MNVTSSESEEKKFELDKKQIALQWKTFVLAFMLCTVGSGYIGYHFQSVSLFVGIFSITVGLVAGMLATTMQS